MIIFHPTWQPGRLRCWSFASVVVLRYATETTYLQQLGPVLYEPAGCPIWSESFTEGLALQAARVV